MTLADRIKERLTAIGMKQIDLVRSSGVPQPTLASILRRDTRTTPHLMKLAAALRTTPAYLLGETDDPEAEGSEAVLSHEERELMIGLRQLSREDFEVIATLVYRLAEPRAGYVYTAEEVVPPTTLHQKRDRYIAASPGPKWGD